MLVVAVAWVLLVPATDWLARHDVGSARVASLQPARDAARGRLLTLGAGLLAAGALLFTARTFLLSREGQVTDRYTKAIEQLGSEKLDVRIGGIYALERVASDSVRDHPFVMEVLAAFVREHSREEWPLRDSVGRQRSVLARVRGLDREWKRSTRPDVQTALTVVGRRDTKRDTRNIDLTDANLTRANLIGAKLGRANLGGAFLTDAYLVGANLTRANLSDADLTDADLTLAFLSGANHTNLTDSFVTGADLLPADLTDAFLARANLTRAKLTGAKLGRVNLWGANLTSASLLGADLTGADLTGADLTGADLTGADLDGTTWPADKPVPEGWKLDTGSGQLKSAGIDFGPAEAN